MYDYRIPGDYKTTLEYNDSSFRRSVQPIDHIWFEWLPISMHISGLPFWIFYYLENMDDSETLYTTFYILLFNASTFLNL